MTYVPDNKIDQVDRGILVGFFNDGGYVLDFSTADFILAVSEVSK